MLGVAGDDTGNPFAAPRSRPYPQPAFPFGPDGVKLAERLRQSGIVLHATAQARTRTPLPSIFPVSSTGAALPPPSSGRPGTP